LRRPAYGVLQTMSDRARRDAPEISKTCCFSGHRPKKLPWGNDETDDNCVSLKKLIFDAVSSLYDEGIRHFICGMATGCDTYFAESVIALREEKADVTLEAAVPYEGQSDHWRDRDRERYNRLTEACDFLTVVQSHYSPDCMARRNRYMVDNSGVLLAAYNGSKGGTMQTMLYAMRRGLSVVEISIDG